jgi:acetylornithine deacetylase/succinyl-diaminopimelate desuccinylase family protein
VNRGVISVEDSRWADLYALVGDLVAFRTESQSPDADHFPTEVRRCVDYVRHYLEELGFAVETWDVGPSATFEAHPVISAYRAGQGSGRSLAFNGHLDVVPSGARHDWRSDPYVVDLFKGRLYGRGTADMKGNIAAALWAVKDVVETSPPLRGDIYFHLVSDEEVVGRGTREIVDRSPSIDCVLSLEPSGLAIEVVEGGLIHFRVEIEGVASHAGTRYLSLYPGGETRGGVNAIEKMMSVVMGLRELEREWANELSHPLLPSGYNTLLPGIIVGGPGGGQDGRLNQFSNPGTTPDYCSVEYNLWHYPEQELDDVRARVEERIHDIARCDKWLREHPPRVTWGINNIWFPPSEVDPKHPVVRTMSDVLGETGLVAEIIACRGATDLAWYGQRKMPGIILGAGHLEQCHAPDEFISVDELVRAAEIYGRFIETWCR